MVNGVIAALDSNKAIHQSQIDEQLAIRQEQKHSSSGGGGGQQQQQQEI